MCHEADSRPTAASDLARVRNSDTHLVSADGTTFMAYFARSVDARSAAGVVILPDMRGLHGFYRQLADQFAAVGVTAVAIDYFGRDLPDDDRIRPAQEMLPLVMALPSEQVAVDVRAATNELVAAGASKVYCVGFCFGGSQAWNQSAFDPRLAGCAGLYGKPDDCRPFLPRMAVPLLLLIAGQDFMTPAEDFDRFEAELREADVPHEMIRYPEAPHAFFEEGSGYEAECADAWRRLLEFVGARRTS